jgi:hypothetical protein
MASTVEKREDYAPAQIHKEVQRTLALVAMTQLYETGEQFQTNQLHDKIAAKVHGDPDNANSVSLVSLFLRGEQQFSTLFDRETLTNNMEGNSERDTGETLVMKSSIIRNATVRHFVGKALTHRSVSSATLQCNGQISGKTLFGQGSRALPLLKKVIAIIEKYTDANGNLPSGLTEEDLDDKILDWVWHHLGGRNEYTKEEYDKAVAELQSDGFDFNAQLDSELEAAEAADNNDDDNTNGRSPTYYFNGWMALKCIGPRAPAPYRSTLFQLGDFPNIKGNKKKSNGRDSIRKEQAKEATQAREAAQAKAVGGSPFKSGVTLAARSDVAKVAIATQSNHLRQIDQKILVKKTALESATAGLQHLNQEISEYRKRKRDGEVLEEWETDEMKELVKEKKAQRDKISALEQEISNLADQPEHTGAKVADAFMKSVMARQFFIDLTKDKTDPPPKPAVAATPAPSTAAGSRVGTSIPPSERLTPASQISALSGSESDKNDNAKNGSTIDSPMPYAV